MPPALAGSCASQSRLSALRRQARKEGMQSLREDGARHVESGLTTVDEVLRVAREEAVVVEA